MSIAPLGKCMSTENFVTYWLARADLPYFLEPHEFYVSEARRRLLSQFGDLDQEAEQREEQFLKASAQYFNPDYDDPSEAYEQAYHEGVSYAWSQMEMQNSVLLAVTAGMYHQFDKMLRKHTIKQLSNWCKEEIIIPMIWNFTFNQLIDFLEWIGLKINGTVYGEKLKACNLVVNVYKHGDGDSHQTLSLTHPEYYPHPTGVKDWQTIPVHDDLQVTEEQFVEFADAITAFWKAVPEYCYYADLEDEPKWIEKVLANMERKKKKSNSNHKAS